MSCNNLCSNKRSCFMTERCSKVNKPDKNFQKFWAWYTGFGQKLCPDSE